MLCLSREDRGVETVAAVLVRQEFEIDPGRRRQQRDSVQVRNGMVTAPFGDQLDRRAAVAERLVAEMVAVAGLVQDKLEALGSDLTHNLK